MVMEKCKIFGKMALYGLLISALIWGASYANAKDNLFFASTHSASGHYVYAAAVTDAINELVDDVNVTLMETGGSKDSLELLRVGKANLGLISYLAAADLRAGRGFYKKDQARPEIRGIYIYAPLPNVIVVRADSGVEKIKDLDGKPFNPGGLGTTTEAVNFKFFKDIGVSPKFYRAGMKDAADALKDGRIVGFVKTVASINKPDSLIQTIMATTKLRIVGFEEKHRKYLEPDLAVFFIIPAGVYPEQTEDVLMYGNIFGVGTRSDGLSRKNAYQIAKVIFEQTERQKAAYPVLPDNLVELTIQHSTIPLHAGVIDYLKEKGVAVPQELIPPEYK
jgi:TRAP transporter TAXI family solute receptor